MSDVVHKEKMFLDEKDVKGCEGSEKLRRLVFCDENRLKICVLTPLPKSVFSEFEAGKTYWIEIKEVSSE